MAEHLALIRAFCKWTLFGTLVGGLAGSASALFLYLLSLATETRLAHHWLLWLLPAGGFLIGWVYHTYAGDARKGNNLLLEEIHQPQGRVPFRMAPLILATTVLTHLLGGSAGREGTAVQMGGSLAATLSRFLKLSPEDRRLLLMSGISAGFGSVFGTPLAGTIFGLEVLRVGGMRYDALLACLVASYAGDWVTSAWGAHHTHYAVSAAPALSLGIAGKIAVAAVAFGLTSLAFASLTHWLKDLFASLLSWAPLRPVVGGVVVIGMTYLVGTTDYLGLGVPMISRAVSPEAVPTLAFAWKLAFTAVTLGSGFQGGEVTPLFFMGATLGHTLGGLMGLPADFMGALGFVAVFGAAANTPLACLAMGIELFGGGPMVAPLALACILAYIFSGHHGIYLAQPLEVSKSQFLRVPGGSTLFSLLELRRKPQA